MDVAAVASIGGGVTSLVTLGTILWKGGAMAQTLKALVEHSEKTNGIIADIIEDRVERGESIARCQALQKQCLDEHMRERSLKMKG